MITVLKILAVTLLLSTVSCLDSSNSSKEDNNTSVEDQTTCNKSQNNSSFEKPTGVFTSVITPNSILPQVVKGGLIRITWAELEPMQGVFNFSLIEEKKALLQPGQSWSLAVHGGYTSVDELDPDLYNGSTYPNGDPIPSISLSMSPSWLVDNLNAETFEMNFRAVSVQMPKYWDNTVQNRISIMMTAVASQYNSDPDLKLVYVPQMTSNGIEGHFNGVPHSVLLEAADLDPLDPNAEDFFEDIWVNASTQATLSTSTAFSKKAIAFEVHEVIDRVSIPEKILEAFLTDESYENRVGAAMWWISGKTSYQPGLVELLKNYTGDLYGQVIGNTTDPSRFENNDYSEVFTQAKELCMRYIEPWNYEFENSTSDSLMKDFNTYAEEYFN